MGMVFLLENLGFGSQLPQITPKSTQEIKFLGFMVNSVTEASRGEDKTSQAKP